MKFSSRTIIPLLTGFLLLVVLPGVASACSVCMGANSKTGGAINDAIFLMLGLVAFMLTGIVAFILNLRKRAQAPVPPHVEITSAMTAQENAK